MVLERTYNVPLRKEWLKAPMYRRTKKAVTALTEFVSKHMKVDVENVRLGKFLNLELWKNGIKNPPHHIKVTIVKDDEGVAKVELFGKTYEDFKRIEKQEKSKKDELMDKLGVKKAKKEESPVEMPKEEKVGVKSEGVSAEDKPKKAKKKKTEVVEGSEKQ